jgi:lysophospholipase L1-like esterase
MKKEMSDWWSFLSYDKILFIVLILLLPVVVVAQPPVKNQKLQKVVKPIPGESVQGVISVKVDPKSGIDQNKNKVYDLPNSKTYATSPLSADLNAISLVMSQPANTSPHPTHPSLNMTPNNLKGIWKWRLSTTEKGNVFRQKYVNILPVSKPSTFRSSVNQKEIIVYTETPRLKISLHEGKWDIHISKINTGGKILLSRQAVVELEDILVVHLGDSYSSGEGAPDRKKQYGYWGDTGNGNGILKDHQNAHRSSRSWGTAVAVHLENESKSTAVTYINLAVSGAVIRDIPDQLRKLRTIIGDKQVDMVLLSIGGNDAGLANAIAAYVLREPIDNLPDLGPSLSDIKKAIQTGNWSGGHFDAVGSMMMQLFDWTGLYDWEDIRGVDRLDAGYAATASYLADITDPSNVFILVYPDPLVADPSRPDEVCPKAILTAIDCYKVRRCEVGRKEQKHARNNLIIPLNNEIRKAASKYGWNYIDAEKAFYGYAISEEDRMVVRYKESAISQGDDRGTMHPNMKGYRAIAEEAIKTINKYYQ